MLQRPLATAIDVTRRACIQLGIGVVTDSQAGEGKAKTQRHSRIWIERMEKQKSGNKRLFAVIHVKQSGREWLA
jgi:hypothetical protein